MIRFDLQSASATLSQALDALGPWIAGVAFLLTLFGYYQQVWRQRHDPPRMFQALGLTAATVLVAFSSALWWPLLVNLLYFPAEQLARQDPLFRLNDALNFFLNEASRLVSDQGVGNNGHGALSPVWNYTWNLDRITRAGVADLVLHVFVCGGTLVAAFLVLPFYFLQHFLVAGLGAGLPAAVCALNAPSLRGRAAGYFALTLSLLCWPLGFTFVAFVTNAVLHTPFLPANAGPAATALAPSLRTLVAALVMVIGTLLVPPTTLYLFLHETAPGPGSPPPR